LFQDPGDRYDVGCLVGVDKENDIAGAPGDFGFNVGQAFLTVSFGGQHINGQPDRLSIGFCSDLVVCLVWIGEGSDGDGQRGRSVCGYSLSWIGDEHAGKDTGQDKESFVASARQIEKVSGEERGTAWGSLLHKGGMIYVVLLQNGRTLLFS
jgi:hypothetical protein